MITITGGKLTTWRRMAKMTVDRIVERDGRDAPCRTARDPARDGRSTPHDLPRVAGRGRGRLRSSSPAATATPRTRCCARRRARRSSPRRSSPGCPTCSPRPSYAARREQARTRRRRAAAAHPARADRRRRPPHAPARVADVLGAELGWDAARRARGRRLPRGGAAEGILPTVQGFQAARTAWTPRGSSGPTVSGSRVPRAPALSPSSNSPRNSPQLRLRLALRVHHAADHQLRSSACPARRRPRAAPRRLGALDHALHRRRDPLAAAPRRCSRPCAPASRSSLSRGRRPAARARARRTPTSPAQGPRRGASSAIAGDRPDALLEQRVDQLLLVGEAPVDGARRRRPRGGRCRRA